MACRDDEVLYEGERGPGKTDGLLMAFAQFVGNGFGRAWRGVIFREEATQLKDIIEKSQTWFPQIFPRSKFIGGGEAEWRFKTGETLLFRHARVARDYSKYHGSAFPFIGFEELCNWAFPDVYLKMMSLCRSTKAGMPRMIRATTNSYGVGHGWVKARFIDPMPRGDRYVDPETGLSRRAIHGRLEENKILLEADPNYLAKVIASANGDPMILDAWVKGSWDIVAGGIFAGRWDPEASLLRPFKIPKGWVIDRAFDDGHSKPYAVGWFAESDGSPATLSDGTTRHFPRGSVFLIAELYGWNGKPNEGLNQLTREKAEAILEVEVALKRTMLDGHTIYPGPADSAIYDVKEGKSVASVMSTCGVDWLHADKGRGSRVAGWQHLGGMMKEARSFPMEEPAFFAFQTCRQFIRTVPTMARNVTDPDDADSEQEDHMGDMVRYRVMRPDPTGVGAVRLPRVH